MALPDFTTQNPATYKANIDAAFATGNAPLTLAGGTVAGTGWGLGTATAWWSKVGSIAVYNISIYCSTIGVGASGNLEIHGLPFVFNTQGQRNIGSVQIEAATIVLPAGYTYCTINGKQSDDALFLMANGSGKAAIALKISDLTAVFQFKASIVIDMSTTV